MNPLLSLVTWPLDVNPGATRGDVLIVLGAALAPDGRLGPALEERVVAGAQAWRAGVAPKMIVTGRYEASVMAERAVELGVDRAAILLEHTALTTRENALFSSELMRTHRLRRALVVTQPYHRLRAVAAFRQLGVDVQALAFPSERVQAKQVAREYVALAAYAARGWLAF